MRAAPRFLPFLLPFASLWAQTPQSVLTQGLPFPQGGTLTVKRLVGDLTVEAWDKPDAQLTAVFSSELKGGSAKLVAAADGGASLETTLPHSVHVYSSGPSLKIYVPRDARLVVERGDGELHVVGLAGDVRASLRYGTVTVQTPASASPSTDTPAIDAKVKLGEINSDFDGPRHSRWKLFQRSLLVSGSGRKLFLRICYGDILLVRTWREAQIAAK